MTAVRRRPPQDAAGRRRTVFLAIYSKWAVLGSLERHYTNEIKLLLDKHNSYCELLLRKRRNVPRRQQ